jgi:hypothetical protein
VDKERDLWAMVFFSAKLGGHRLVQTFGGYLPNDITSQTTVIIVLTALESQSASSCLILTLDFAGMYCAVKSFLLYAFFKAL